MITNVTTRLVPELLESKRNYQYIDGNGQLFLAGSSDHVFSLYKLDLRRGGVIPVSDVKHDRTIVTFKLLNLPNSSEPETESDFSILAILCVESDQGNDLLWYNFNGTDLVRVWSWEGQNLVESLQFFHHGRQHRLLVLREEVEYNGQKYSPIDIYGFSTVGEPSSYW